MISLSTEYNRIWLTASPAQQCLYLLDAKKLLVELQHAIKELERKEDLDHASKLNYEINKEKKCT